MSGSLIAFLICLFAVCLLFVVVFYLVLIHKKDISDKNNNFIPDPVEAAAKELNRRAERVKEELKDVADAITGENKK